MNQLKAANANVLLKKAALGMRTSLRMNPTMTSKTVFPALSIIAEHLHGTPQSSPSVVRALHHKAGYSGPTKRRGGHTKKTKKGDNWVVRPIVRKPLSSYYVSKGFSPKAKSLLMQWKAMNKPPIFDSAMLLQQRHQVRALSSEMHFTDENEFDSMLHERELEMHRHPAGPVHVITDLARKAMKGKGYDSKLKDAKILDIESQPYDSMVILAREFPDASVYSVGSSTEAVRVMADRVLQLGVPNITTQLFNSSNLSAFEDASFDVITSCYGLQHCRDPENLIREIHRVLRPGGTFVASIWEHLETEPIIDQIMQRVAKGKTPMNGLKLTEPHLVEKMIEQSGLWCVDIEHGEYPLCLSPDGLPSSAFDLISLPIKKTLGKMMRSGEQPYAFEEARTAFDTIVAKGDLIRKDSDGKIIIEDNRFKVLVARRRHEDADTLKHIAEEKKKEFDAKALSSVSLKKLDPSDAQNMSVQFDALLGSAFTGNYSPVKKISLAVKRTIEAGGHDLKKANVLDLGSHLGPLYQNEPSKLLAETFPDACIHMADLSAERLLEEMNSGAAPKGLDITDTSVVNLQQLSSIKNGSMDVVLCAFGLTYFEDPKAVMEQIHRILKPGGSFIASTWDSISLEHISYRILSGVLKNFKDQEAQLPCELLNLTALAEPRKLERLVEYSGLGVTKSVHYEFPFVLSKTANKDYLEGDLVGDIALDDEHAFETAILPIRHVLRSLEESGENPSAMADARRVFSHMVKEGELVSFDKHGHLVTVPNRFKLMIARRMFEDGDPLEY